MGLKEGKKVTRELVGSVKQVKAMNDLGMFSAPPVAWFKRCVCWGLIITGEQRFQKKLKQSLMEPLTDQQLKQLLLGLGLANTFSITHVLHILSSSLWLMALPRGMMASKQLTSCPSFLCPPLTTPSPLPSHRAFA